MIGFENRILEAACILLEAHAGEAPRDCHLRAASWRTAILQKARLRPVDLDPVGKMHVTHAVWLRPDMDPDPERELSDQELIAGNGLIDDGSVGFRILGTDSELGGKDGEFPHGFNTIAMNKDGMLWAVRLAKGVRKK